MSVLVIDIFVWILLFKGYNSESRPIESPYEFEDEDLKEYRDNVQEFKDKETAINIVVRGSQFLILFIFSFVLCILYTQHQERR